VLALCVWVLIDSIHLGARRGGLGGGMLDYACTRPRLVTRHRALKSIGWTPAGPSFARNMPPQPMHGYVPQRGVRAIAGRSCRDERSAGRATQMNQYAPQRP